MDSKKAVSERLREFGSSRFGNLSEFARALGMPKRANLDPYLMGKSLPGFELLDKIQALGCDLYWLMTGNDRSEQDKRLREELTRPRAGEFVWVEETIDKWLQRNNVATTPAQRKRLIEAARNLARRQVEELLAGGIELQKIIHE